MAVNVDIVDDFFSLICASVSEPSRLVTHIQLYPRQNTIEKRDRSERRSLTVSRFKRYLNDTGIVVFSKFIS